MYTLGVAPAEEEFGQGYFQKPFHWINYTNLLLLVRGSWCSGITPAQHAGGPGLNPQTVHAEGSFGYDLHLSECQHFLPVFLPTY